MPGDAPRCDRPLRSSSSTSQLPLQSTTGLGQGEKLPPAAAVALHKETSRSAAHTFQTVPLLPDSVEGCATLADTDSACGRSRGFRFGRPGAEAAVSERSGLGAYHPPPLYRPPPPYQPSQSCGQPVVISDDEATPRARARSDTAAARGLEERDALIARRAVEAAARCRPESFCAAKTMEAADKP